MLMNKKFYNAKHLGIAVHLFAPKIALFYNSSLAIGIFILNVKKIGLFS